MYRKLLSAIFAVCALTIGAAAAQNAFPVSRTDIDGVTRSGYLDEDGTTVLPFAYAQAGEFAACGLAAVEDEQWQTALIDRSGRLVVPYTASPVSVEFSADMAVYRYADHSVYYTTEGETVGSYPGAVGFFGDGLLLCKDAQTGLYTYVTTEGVPAFAGAFREAGAFSGGRALVRAVSGAYFVIDTAGQTLYTLESSVAPAYMTIFGTDTVVLSNGTNMALYSLSRGAYLTEFIYNSISPFHDGVAMVRQVNRWGLMDTSGKYLTEPVYYYLSYMGEGLYAARGQDGSCAAVDADGSVIYRTPSFAGGFTELKYGLSWHGTADGSLIFFRRNGGYFASLKNAENPTLLSENVVRVTQDSTTKYINLSDEKTLFTQPTSFALGGGVTVSTVHYEKFLGYQADGSEYGWNVDFPAVSGLPDAAVQREINDAIRAFFLKGPSVSAEYEALEGGYGASLEGSVLVVWASCVSGRGAGASVWNNCLAFDLRTGARYQVGDLFRGSYTDRVRALLPAERPMYLYSFPRLSAQGVTYFYNEYESETRRAYTESYLLPFEQLSDLLDTDGACYLALHTPFAQPDAAAAPAAPPVFSDVPDTHWAAAYIGQAAERGLMQGVGGKFRPSDSITAAEVCAAIARGLALAAPDTVMTGIEPDAWYAGEVSAVEAAGLLAGLDDLRLAAPISRADAMQLFANVLVSQGRRLPSAAEADAALAAFSDQAQLSPARRAAAGLCVQAGLIQGAGGRLNPQGYFTRAEFSKLLMLICEDETA